MTEPRNSSRKIEFWKHSTRQSTFFIIERWGRLQAIELNHDETRLVKDLTLVSGVVGGSEYIDSFEPSPRWNQLAEKFSEFHTVLYDDFFPEGMDLVEEYLDSKARRIAERAHPEQSAAEPSYLDHLHELVRILIGFRAVIFKSIHRSDFENLLTAGWLHGILDRTDFSKRELVQEFGERVVDTIESLTFGGEKSGGPAEFRDYLVRIRTDQSAALIFLADRIARMRRTMRRYNPTEAYTYSSQSDFIVTELKSYVPAEMMDEVEDLSIFLVNRLTSQAAD